MPHLPLQIGLHYLWWLLGYQSRTQFISFQPRPYYTTAFEPWWEIRARGGRSREAFMGHRSKYTCLCSWNPPTTQTLQHLEVENAHHWDEVAGGKGEDGEKNGGVDLSGAWSHPMVTMGHPLLRWQWEWQAYLCGCWRALTDWTDRAVGGCAKVTGCISIWVKNLAKVGNMASWVIEGGGVLKWATWAGQTPVSLLFLLVSGLLFSKSVWSTPVDFVSFGLIVFNDNLCVLY